MNSQKPTFLKTDENIPSMKKRNIYVVQKKKYVFVINMPMISEKYTTESIICRMKNISVGFLVIENRLDYCKK